MNVPARGRHLLVVDDDDRIRELLKEYLARAGFRVTAAPGGAAARKLIGTLDFDLAVFDVMMPGEDGFGLTRWLREQRGPSGRTPVLMLTAKGEPGDRIEGLKLGADDYLAKPCNPRELLARVRAVLRRAEQRSAAGGVGAGCEFAGWRLDLVRRELRSPAGVVVNLSSGEFSLLRAFVERPQRVLTRDQLLEFARGPDSDAFDRAIDVQISRLRRKLDDGGGSHELIRTIRNEGYMFTAKVKRT
jgi:two-component system OmpR family response regulator